METFVKDVLYPGVWHIPNGRGGRKKVPFSRRDVRALQQRMQEMIAAGLSIPLAAEHQDQAKPLTAAERKADWVKRLTLGWAEDAEVAPEGYLTARVAVPLAEDAARLPAARFVSPEIVHDFVDGTGRLWPGPSITHLAVTARPVQYPQRPFQQVRMSNVIRLSLQDFGGGKMAEKKKFDLEALRELLESDGYAVPEHIDDPEEFLEHLHTAALSKQAFLEKIVQDGNDADAEIPLEYEEEESELNKPPGERRAVMMSHGLHHKGRRRSALSEREQTEQTVNNFFALIGRKS